jgi:NADPH:quinone reductase-like Zn-dependent oxidoreductase
MKAAVVREFGRPPSYGDFADPDPQAGETKVLVSAAAASPLVRSRVAGSHYSARAELPFVAGIDGVGRTPDGQRVYFLFPRPPFGSMAEQTAVPSDLTVRVPEGLDSAVAAAAANPGMSCWVPLTQRIRIRSGESVLVNGATGAAGRMAVQVSKFLGARKVIATGRDEAKLRTLRELGADTVIPLGQSPAAFRDAVRNEAHESSIGVVLDYLWGPSAESILDALGGPNAPRGSMRIDFVHIGSLSGPTISLPGEKLRSSGVDILGTGIGSSSNRDLLSGIGEFLKAFVTGRFRVDFDAHPLEEVEQVWSEDSGEKRLVLTIP